MLYDKSGHGHVRLVTEAERTAYRQARRDSERDDGRGDRQGDDEARPSESGDSPLDGTTAEEALRALPDMARAAGVILRRSGRWTLGTTMRTGNVLIQGALTGQPAEAIADDLIETLVGEARDTLRMVPGLDAIFDRRITLAERMNALLDASAGVGSEDEGHPAYVRLLSELTPDEARILRLFATKGPQPAVDVRTRTLMGVGSRLVEPGMSMIGRHAGCKNPRRVASYLDNMVRLGLIRFTRDALPDQSVYDVLEAQAEVKEAIDRAGHGVTIRRRIELTVFGENLCRVCGLLPESSS